ncbi:MAG: biotin--[acetyl-CoA-carboxylase] ligase [Bacteroidetes bacterium]|nr:biotin--[acetyl-CoA-carboxylase] ligase [Bacteroidota bacterium]
MTEAFTPFNLADYQSFLTSSWGSEILVFEELESTSDYLRNLPDFNSGLVVLAETQSSGRGRLGRKWADEKGSNLLFSIGWKVETGSVSVPATPLITALAIRDAVQTLTPDMKIKWPNDLLFDGKKSGGILVEARTTGDQMSLVIGIGLNVNQTEFPSWLDVPASSLQLQTGKTISREWVLASVMNKLQDYLTRLRINKKTELLTRYRQHCDTLGQTIRFKFNEEMKTGLAVDIAQDGSLLINVDGEIIAFQGNEISHIRNQS